MKIFIKLTFIVFVFLSCKDVKQENTTQQEPKISTERKMQLKQPEAEKLAKLPLQCIGQEYPNKLSQVLNSDKDLHSPSELHPVFYGCFDWHSAVHGHWSLVKLLKTYPNLQQTDTIRSLLKSRITPSKIKKEIAFFSTENNGSFERTYGWAWLLQLQAELHTWDDPLARELETNLQPLTRLIAQKIKDYLPKLKYPIRVGTHTNTAFALSFAYDYAKVLQDEELQQIIKKRAKDYYLNDKNCPINWEPSGHDFLSPCLEEVDLMRKVLPKKEFMQWITQFLPNLKNKDFTLAIGEVTDRTDGHLVHLDGLNFSRAWVFYGLAKQYKEFEHLNFIGDKHVYYSLPNLVGDSYEGGHWLGSFAIYALTQ